MRFNEVTIYHFLTGWNGVYPREDRDVDSSLGAFTWRPVDSDGEIPPNSTLVANINLNRVDNLENAIGLAIIDDSPIRIDGHEAVIVARKLAAMIVAARADA